MLPMWGSSTAPRLWRIRRPREQARRRTRPPRLALAMKPSRLLLPLALIAPCSPALLFPAVAEAHGIVGRADLPIPVWLFSWAAAIVLVVSFVALSALWTHPQLQTEHRKPLLHIPGVV